MSLKTENSRRVAKSRPVCMGLKGPYLHPMQHGRECCKWIVR
jgi:hypothetical protein